MLPAPRQKLPEISPIFISDKVTLHVSREKDGKLHLVDAGWDDTKVVPRTAAGKLAGGWKGETYPPTGGAMTPLKKAKTPLRPPRGFFQLRCRSRASNRAFFALVF
jgi:hypothetical protein